MKKNIIILALLFLGMSCHTNSEQEDIVPNTDLQTKSIENPQSYVFTLTSNITENIIISRVIFNYPENLEDHFIFSQHYQDVLYENQGFLLLPDPVKGKVWTGVRGNNIMSYDTTTNNKYNAPYLEGYVNQDINIELIYRDSITTNGGSSGGGNGSGSGSVEGEEKYNVYKIHYFSIMEMPNNRYEIIFKIESGIYDPDTKVEINPLIEEKGIVAEYNYWDKPTQKTTLVPRYDYFTLQVPGPTSNNRTLHVTIPNQRHPEKHWELIGLTRQFSL